VHTQTHIPAPTEYLGADLQNRARIWPMIVLIDPSELAFEARFIQAARARRRLAFPALRKR
jgi:hypothetical protein